MLIPVGLNIAITPLLAIAATGTALCLRGAQVAQGVVFQEASAAGVTSVAGPMDSDRACLLVDTVSAWGTDTRMVCGHVMSDDGQELCICPGLENEPDRWVCG
jgi:hypothetical protein